MKHHVGHELSWGGVVDGMTKLVTAIVSSYLVWLSASIFIRSSFNRCGYVDINWYFGTFHGLLNVP